MEWSEVIVCGGVVSGVWWSGGRCSVEEVGLCSRECLAEDSYSDAVEAHSCVDNIRNVT